MDDRVVQTFTSPDGNERILIVQRPDGRYSYRRQWLWGIITNHPDSPARDLNYERVGEWAPLGPYLGFYDCAETAKWEALGRIEWLSATLNPN